MKYYIYILYVAISNWFSEVKGHGRLVDPPSRSSMWRYGYKNPPNYNDNQLYCGGAQVQYEMSNGKCGVCGDPWPGPRDNEEGGKYANGIIVRTYDPGEEITVTVELTASHKGYFQFKLCPRNDPLQKTTQRCLDNYVLELADGSGNRYYIPNKNGYQTLVVKLRLPENVKCRDCTFQWKYNAGNSWGVDSSGRGCLGCGNQEQFYGCADIAIGYDDIDEGDSLITGENYKTKNYSPPPPPVTREEQTQDTNTNKNTNTNWDDDDTPTSFWDSLVSHTDQESEVTLLQEFEKLKRMFKNKNVRPCVCHSCVGNTCVCECLPYSRAHSFISDGVSAWLMYVLSVLSCLIPIILM